MSAEDSALPRVSPVASDDDRREAATLFRELAEHFVSLSFEMDADRVVEELAPDGPFEPPTGRVLLARFDNEPVGCVALRRAEWDPSGRTCEMRRMYVRSEWRGRGVARALTAALLAEARSAGYGRMMLATHSSFEPALELYASMGFERMTPPRDASWDDVVFMEREL